MPNTRKYPSALLLALAILLNSAPGFPESDKTTPAIINTIRWSTASEVENFGYDVYRSEHHDGPFKRLNELPIPGKGTTDVQSDYVYTDQQIEPNTVYYYYVESIGMNGVREKFTPVFASKPKVPIPTNR